jgi:hypothetical protein
MHSVASAAAMSLARADGRLRQDTTASNPVVAGRPAPRTGVTQ